VVFLGLFAWNAYKRQLVANLTILMLLTFIYLSCLSVSVGRSSLFGEFQATTPRYGILSVMLLIGLYLLGLETVRNQPAKIVLALAGLGLAVYVHIASDQLNSQDLRNDRHRSKYAIALYKENSDIVLPLVQNFYLGEETGKLIFSNAVK